MLRQVKYLNNGIESDNRFVKKQCQHKQWFWNWEFAANTTAGYEIILMIKKRQVKEISKSDIIA